MLQEALCSIFDLPLPAAQEDNLLVRLKKKGFAVERDTSGFHPCPFRQEHRIASSTLLQRVEGQRL